MKNMTERGIRVVCKCSSVVYFLPRTESLICRWCGNKIYQNELIKFKDKLQKAIRKEEKK